MKIVNRRSAKPIKTRHGSELRPLIDRTTSDVTQCSLAEELLPPGHAVTPHHHRQLEEIYYILEGHGTMEIAGELRPVGPGDAIAIPPGAVHQISNTGRETLKFLCCCAPGYTHDDTVLCEH